MKCTYVRTYKIQKVHKWSGEDKITRYENNINMFER